MRRVASAPAWSREGLRQRKVGFTNLQWILLVGFRLHEYLPTTIRGLRFEWHLAITKPLHYWHERHVLLHSSDSRWCPYAHPALISPLQCLGCCFVLWLLVLSISSILVEQVAVRSEISVAGG